MSYAYRNRKLGISIVIDSARKKFSPPALKSRRREIEQRLAAFGLTRGPRRLLRGERAASSEEARSRRLRSALEGLGPIFSSFGLYLSSRGDLWPAKDCLELATIPDRVDPTPLSAVKRLLKMLKSTKCCEHPICTGHSARRRCSSSRNCMA